MTIHREEKVYKKSDKLIYNIRLSEKDVSIILEALGEMSLKQRPHRSGAFTNAAEIAINHLYRAMGIRLDT